MGASQPRADPPEELRSAIENALAALICASATEELDRALAIARAAVDHAQLRSDRLAEAMALITVADVLLESDPAAAREARLLARRLAIDVGDAFWELTATYTLAEQAVVCAGLGRCIDRVRGLQRADRGARP